jgi:L-threonylcarbamoyladenylate synthase
MNTQIHSIQDPEAIKLAVSIIKSGGVIAFPTDTVYGIGADLWSEKAINRLYQVKGRSYDKAIPILIGEQSQLNLVVDHAALNPQASQLMNAFWPGAMTLILPKHKSVPNRLSAYPTVGVRMPDHALLLRLLTQTGPLAVTSANRSGQPDAFTAQQVENDLSGRIELILDGGTTPGAAPSTVVDCSTDELNLLRVGEITRELIDTALT